MELHAAHGYLLDSFLRVGEVAYVAELIRGIRHQCGMEFKIAVRFSNWRVNDFEASYLENPVDLERMLKPLVDASVDLLHPSVRRFWEFPFGSDDDLGLAGWTRKITGLPTVLVGNVGLSTAELIGNGPEGISEINRRFAAGHFDLIAMGRPLITDAEWVNKVCAGRFEEITEFFADAPGTIKT